LQQGQDLFDLLRGKAVRGADFFDGDHQVAVPVEVADDEARDALVLPVRFGHKKLPEQVIVQRLLAGDEGLVFGGLPVFAFHCYPRGGAEILEKPGPVDFVVDFLLYGDFLVGGHFGRRGFHGFGTLAQGFVTGGIDHLLQRRILFKLLADGIHQLQPGELQELDGHLQLGGHDQLLGEL